MIQLGIYNKVVKEQPIINLKYIYDNIDQLEVYRDLLGYYPNTNDFYKSPFSRDSTPSLKFRVNSNYKLIYKCFSTGKTGDFVSLALELNSSLNFQQVLNKIYESQRVSKGISEVISFKSSCKNATLDITKRAEVQVVLFDSEPISFLKYFNDFCLDQQILDLYDVKAAKQVFYRKEEPEFKLIKYYKDEDIIIRYLINGEYKIYCPLTKNKKNKWLSTFNSKCIFGFKQLDYSLDTIIISKSSKDVMVWRLLGYNAITLPTEHSRLWKEIVEWLFSKFKYVISILDNDESGINAMIKYKEEWNLPFIILPDLGVENQCKDVAEIIYVLKYSLTLSLVNVLIKDKIKTISYNLNN